MGDEIEVRPVGGEDPYAEFAGTEMPDEYQPWKRPMTYVTFALGINAAGLLFMSLHPAAIVLGWFAMGLGIAAVVCAGKEIALFARAETHPFVKWGKRTGWLGIIIGPLSAIVWIIILAALGLRF